MADQQAERGGPRKNTYYLALGSNLGNREANLRRAWAMLAPLCGGMRLSSLYETQPRYVENQPLFLNAVGEAASALEPTDMLRTLHDIERSLGRDRQREIRMGPRTIDLDILLCGDLIVSSPSLTIPHPRLAERRFVLVPLLELAPHLRDPQTGQDYARALTLLEAAEGAGGVYLYLPA